MRVGLFTDTYSPQINGVATSTAMLKKGLEKLGHKVYIVTTNDNALHFSLDSTGTILRIPGIPTGIYDYRLTGLYPMKAINQIKKWHLDVIHSQTEFGIGTFARIVSKQYNIPLVHTYHTMYEDYVHYITHGYFKKTSQRIVEYLTLFYCDKTINELIVPTKKAWELFKDKYLLDRSVHIIPTGIDIDRFKKENHQDFNKTVERKKLNLNENDFVILFVGRIASEKNIEFLLQNMNKVLKKCPTAKLLIIGDGPDLNKYKELTGILKISDNIIFTGKIPWEEIPKYYLLSDIFVTASTTETQGLTIIEALAATLPVVCINDESFNNIIINHLNGLLFNNDDEYVDAICKLYNDSITLKRMQKGAINSVEPYTDEYFASHVEKVYENAIVNYTKNKLINKIKMGKKNKEKREK